MSGHKFTEENQRMTEGMDYNNQYIALIKG